MSMEKLRCPTCSHYALCSIGGEITDTQARTCKSYSYIPTPSMPRPIYGKIERYEYDVESGTISCKVIQTNADRIRSMTDEELAEKFNQVETIGRFNGPMGKTYWKEWLGKEVKE